jgi:phosphatidylglycerophosphatase A
LKPAGSKIGLPLWRPAAFVATGFGAGMLPLMPGTWGSLAALPCGWAIRSGGGLWWLLVAAAVAFALGCWASARVTSVCGRADPGFIVIDEIAAQWLVLAGVPLNPWWYAAAFLLFRVFDIAKPWPIHFVERAVPGGLGVMLDDVVAAFYAVAILLIAEALLGLGTLT